MRVLPKLRMQIRKQLQPKSATTSAAGNNVPLITRTENTENAANNDSATESTNTDSQSMCSSQAIASDSGATAAATGNILSCITPTTAAQPSTENTENAINNDSAIESTNTDSQSMCYISHAIATTSASGGVASRAQPAIALTADDVDEGFFGGDLLPMPLMSVRHGIVKHEGDDVSGGLAYKATVYHIIYFPVTSRIIM